MKFTDMKLIPELQEQVKAQGYTEPTPIQAQTIPAALKGQDVLGIAQTGTGKTAAFALPLLHRIADNPTHPKPKHMRALILTPTRELAAQVERSLKTYGKKLSLHVAVVYGGVGQRPQEKALKQGVDVLVATPGRLLDLHRQKHLSLKDIDFFVLDEADRMLDMGFMPDIEEVLRHTTNIKQTLFFSATMPKPIEKLARSMLKNPVRVEIEPQAITSSNVDQYVMYVSSENKNDLLLHLLESDHLEHVLVFTRTKRKADRLARLLKRKGHESAAIHGDKSQSVRTRVLAQFRHKKIEVLVATEVAARGLDVDDITHVINLDTPHNPESYVHRIGRTGRAGKKGVAYVFCDAQERSLIKDIEKRIGESLKIKDHKYHSQKALESNQKYSHPGRGRGRGNKGSRKHRSKSRKGNNKKHSRSNKKGSGKKNFWNKKKRGNK